MKNFNLILLLLITSLCYSQTRSPSDDLMNFEPGQLIVKFKDDYRANITYDSKGVGTTKLDLNAIPYSITKVVAILKTLAPEGQKIIIKTNEGTRYYKLDWRDDYGTHGKPFKPKENINNSSE